MPEEVFPGKRLEQRMAMQDGRQHGADVCHSGSSEAISQGARRQLHIGVNFTPSRRAPWILAGVRSSSSARTCSQSRLFLGFPADHALSAIFVSLISGFRFEILLLRASQAHLFRTLFRSNYPFCIDCLNQSCLSLSGPNVPYLTLVPGILRTLCLSNPCRFKLV